LGKRGPKPKSTEDNFNKHVNRNIDGCWIWTAALNEHGYGVASINRKSILAHRLSYMIKHGDIPDGMFVCHSCDVRPCVNPDHLFVGSARDNSIDMVKKNRCRKSSIGLPRGVAINKKAAEENKYQASSTLCGGGRLVYLGLYGSAEEAEIIVLKYQERMLLNESC